MRDLRTLVLTIPSNAIASALNGALAVVLLAALWRRGVSPELLRR